MKTKLLLLVLAFLALNGGLDLAAFALAIVVLVLMVGEALELPEPDCTGNCGQGRMPCDCRTQVNTKE